ncbi:MAG TPA: glycosyltransferase [Pedobacter sp.]
MKAQIKSVRVLHVIAGMDPTLGGVSQAVRTIVAGLDSLNVHNEVVCLDPISAVYLSEDSFVTHALGKGKGPWLYNKDLLSWLKTNIALFDIVIVHGLWLYHGYAVKEVINGLKKQKKYAPKFFLMPHGMLDPYFQRAPGRKLKALRNLIFWHLVEQKIVNSSDGILFTCEMERVLAQGTFDGYKARKEYIVGLGVEEPPSFENLMLEAFTKRLPNATIGPYILFISRIHPKKGIDLLIKAYTNLKQLYLAMPALVIAGPGLDTEYGAQIQALSNKVPNIYFTGMLSGNEKWGAFYGCEAFILPSHQENFGIAVVEGLACGRPALISNQVNIWKEIADSGGGMVAEDNLQGVQEILKKWLELPESDRKIMGLKARSCFESNYAVSAASNRLLETF